MSKKIYLLIKVFLVISAITAIAKAETITVRKTTDTNNPLPCGNDCSLREAINTINASPFAGVSRIDFAIPLDDLRCSITTPKICRIDLTFGSEMAINSASSMLTIDGGSAIQLTINGSPQARRIFSIGSNVTIKNLTLQGGNGSGSAQNSKGSAIYMNGSNGGALALDAVVLQNNDSAFNSNSSGSVYFFGGIGHSIRNSTIARNASNFCGGFESNGATVSVVNATISFNTATNSGGAACVSGSGTTTMRNVTMADNFASQGGGIVVSGGTLDIASSIVAKNTATDGFAPDFRYFNGTIVAAGGNLIGNNQTVELWFPAGQPNGSPNQDWVGDSTAPLAPLLAPLGLAGGTTPTRPIFSTSPANNHGNTAAIETPPDDQRGALRGGGIDIGAFELNSVTFTASFGGSVNQPYSQTITTDNSGSAYCISSGALPAGLSGIPDCSPPLSIGDKLFAPQAQVVITGTPTQPGIYDFTVRTSSGANSLTTNYRIVIAAPTAASVAVSGRILTADGRGISAARVSIVNHNGETRTALTNSFGYYRFNEISAGETYVVSIAHKRFQFADNPRALTVQEAISELNFTAEP